MFYDFKKIDFCIDINFYIKHKSIRYRKVYYRNISILILSAFFCFIFTVQNVKKQILIFKLSSMMKIKYKTKFTR